jgi:hypothetical protein
MKTPAFAVAAAAACALAGAAVGQPAPPPYNDTPASYPWRNGLIEGPGGPGPGPYGGFGGAGYGGNGAGPGYAGPAGYPGPGPVNGPGDAGGGYGAGPGGPPAIFPLPDNGAYAVGLNTDGSLTVIRYGPVWTSEVGPNGWSHRHYVHYGFPFSGIWPFN